MNYKNCLRPEFTKRIITKILEDKSLNPFGGKGIGKKRLLEDLEDLARQVNIQTVRIDLKAHRLSYASFLKQSELQMLYLSEENKDEYPLLMSGKMDEPIENLPSVSLLVQNTKVNINQHLLILLENFDVLIGSAEHNFPIEFFTDLNALKGTRNVTLCCSTEKSHMNSTLFFDGGRTQRTSFLDLEPIDIPPLQMHEIRNVLNKKLDACENWQNEPQKQRYISAISQTENPMVFMDLLIDDFYYHNSPFEIRLKKCKNQYKKRYKVKHENWRKNISWKYIKAEIIDILRLVKRGKKVIK